MSFSGADASDQQLVDRVRAGDKNAFNFLVLRYQNRVAALVARFIKDHQEVEDDTTMEVAEGESKSIFKKQYQSSTKTDI
jgi:hypothetical protein